MNPETLRGLLVDRELGELAPDMVELLDAYLEAVPAARSEVNAVTRTVSTARETVRRFPDLAPTTETERETRVIPINPWLARAAALVAVAGLAAWIGYHAGVSGSSVGKAEVVARAVDHRFNGLWTRYQVAYDSHRAAFVVEERQ